jgi:hypothetical protein
MAVDPKDSANYPSGEDTDHGVQVDHRDGNSEGDDETEYDDNGNENFIDAADASTEEMSCDGHQRHILFRKWQ